MRLVDVNVLLYAHDSSSARHDRARDWWADALSDGEQLGIPTVVVLAFVRLTTRAVVVTNPWSASRALDVVESWFARPQVVDVPPGRRHRALLREMLGVTGSGGNLVTDAHLAALAVEHGAVLCSTDHDFGRFPGLRWVDPLAKR